MASKDSKLVSDYFKQLDVISKERYLSKLTVDGVQITDPYSNSSLWKDDITKWPSVEHGNIHNYLVNTPGIYTKEALKAYKSLDGYNYFVSGHVQMCLYNDVSQDSSVCVMKAKVTPSQRIRDRCHEPWVVINKSLGYVVAAHCTCKAGLGEACSHIAAVLFKVNAAGTLGLNTESRTSLKCIWNKYYRKQIDAVPVTKMEFSKSVHGKKRKRKMPEPAGDDSDNDFDESAALQQLKQICPTACILTKTDSDTDSASDDEDIPPLLTRFCEIEYRGLNEDKLKEKAEVFVRDFQVTDSQCKNLEIMTRSQSDSALWKRQREGRITATVAHDIKTKKDSTSSSSLLRKIMKYSEVDLSKVEAVAFGKKFEPVARKLYKTLMNETPHDEFSVRECGLIVDKTFPLFAASPDGLRVCKCHGEGLIEIKCSFKHQDIAVEEIPNIDSGFYLEKETLILKKGHKYYSQVQFQMFVSGKTFCDFVVYTKQGIHVQTILFDPMFVDGLVQKCTEFAYQQLVPELLSQKLR